MASDESVRGGFLGGAGQRTSERVGGHDAEVSQPRELTWDRMKRRAAEALFLLLCVPLLLGPWALVVYVPLYLERIAYAAARWFNLWLDEVDRVSMACIGVLILLALVFVPDAALVWWPFAWQRSAESLRGLLWPGWWPAAIPFALLLRVVPIVAIPGVYNVHRLPEAPPQVTVQPIRPVPYNAPKASLVLDVLQSPTGKQIGADDVLDMLEAQPAAGLSWRTWHSRNWTRSDWEAALEILEAQGLVTPRQSGRATALTVSVDDAMDAIERLT